MNPASLMTVLMRIMMGYICANGGGDPTARSPVVSQAPKNYVSPILRSKASIPNR